MKELINDPVFSEFLDHDSMNCGGCGIYALAVARYLMNRGFYNLEIIACCRWYEQDIKENIENNNHIIDNVPAHIALKAGNYCFDAERGVFDHEVFIELMEDDGKESIIIDFKEDDLVKAINQIDCWNPCFDRAELIPVIEKNFDVSLKDLII